MKQCLFYVIFSVLAHTLAAQQPDTIAYKKKFFGVYRYYKPEGGKYQQGELKRTLLNQPASAVYFHKYRVENWAAFGAGLAGVALMTYGGRDNVQLRYLRKANPYLIASTAVLGGCLYLILHSIKQYRRAVKAYNRTIQKQW